METTIQHIELINQYLDNLLSGTAKSSFIKKLENDSEFNQIYQEHLIIMEGINRITLKQDISKARQSYITKKWIKFSVIGIAVIASLFLLYIFLLKPIVPEPNQPLKEDIPALIPFESKQSKNEKESTDSIVANDYIMTTIQSDSSAHKKGNEPFSSVTKQSQILSIDASRDTIIKLKEGTVLNIKANSFVNKGKNSIVKGRVKLEVTEYYTASDMLLANLTTTSNGKLLETGGMLYIEASQNESLLDLKENEPITISFPTKKYKEGMQMFSGNMDENGMNWILESGFGEQIVSEPESIEVPFAVVEKIPSFPGCENLNVEENRNCVNNKIKDHIQQNFNTNIALQLGLTGRQRINTMFKIMTTGEIQYIQSSGNRQELIEEANRVMGLLPRMIPGMQRGRAVVVPYSVPILFEVVGNLKNSIQKKLPTRDGESVTDVIFIGKTIAFDTVYSPSRGLVERIREVMHDADFHVDPTFIQQWDLYRRENLVKEIGKTSDRRFLIRKQVFENQESRFKILDDDSITRGGHIIRIPWDESKVPTTSSMVQIIPRQTHYVGNEAVTSEEFETRMKDDQKTKSITTKDLNNYILKTSKLGWINCDRFINGRTKRIKYKLKIKNSDNAIVNMVLTSSNSILPSWKSNEDFDFGTVGDAEDITLVAIKKQEEKIFLATVETKTMVNPTIDFNFKEVTLHELKEELKKLNKLFD